MENSLDILADSLDKKIDVLNRIQEYNAKQEKEFLSGQPSMDFFDASVAEKDALIDEIMKLDEGFETLYEHLAKNLEQNKSRYAEQIKILQNKISRVTELSVAVQASEARNKKLIEDYFANRRNSIRKERIGSAAAYNYYRNMSGGALLTSQYMDHKN